MPSEEYWAGRNLEKNELLHETVIKIFKFDRVESDGSTGTKGDIVGFTNDERTHISVKNASGKNTQVHLPTLNSLADQLKMPENVYNSLDRFLGTNDLEQWASWSQGLQLTAKEQKYRRIRSSNIPDWNLVLQWFNDNRQRIAVLLLQSLNNEHPAPWLIWVDKKKGGFQAVDVNKIVRWVTESCTWINSRSKHGHDYNLWCVGPNQEKIFSMQMKGSGGPAGGYNHCPQFHLYKTWPQEFVVYEDSNIRF